MVATINGTSGNDFLNGTALADIINGLAGNDVISGQAGADRIDGGIGFDSAAYSSSTAAVNVNLTTGIGIGGYAQGDRLFNIEQLSGSAFNDVLVGNAYDNTLIGLGGADRLDGGAGFDAANYALSNAAINVNLSTGIGSGGHAAGDRLARIEEIVGSNFNDFLTGDAFNNTLEGGAGADALNGLGGLADMASYWTSTAGVAVNLTTGTGAGGHAAGDRFAGIEYLLGSRFNDVLIGNSGANTLEGGVGADVLNGSSGTSDAAAYYRSTAAVNVSLVNGRGFGGHAAGDRLAGIESLVGSNFADVLTGNAANNLLSGGQGNDRLSSGAGFDYFWYYAANFGRDILDYDDNFDSINLRGSGLNFGSFTVQQVGANTVLTLNSAPANAITLLNTQSSNIGAEDFIV